MNSETWAINGARKDESFASFTENVFFGIIDRRMKLICNEVSNVVAGFK